MTAPKKDPEPMTEAELAEVEFTPEDGAPYVEADTQDPGDTLIGGDR